MKGSVRGVLIGLGIIMALWAACYIQSGIASRRENARQAQLAADKQKREQAAEAAFNAMTPAEHLAAVLQSPLANNAQKHLAALPAGSPERKKAEGTISQAQKAAEVANAKERKARQVASKQAEIARRKQYAKTMEELFLNESKMDTTCYVEGENDDVLVIKYGLMGRVTVNELLKGGLWDSAGPMGFRRIRFVNNITDEAWSSER